MSSRRSPGKDAQPLNRSSATNRLSGRNARALSRAAAAVALRALTAVRPFAWIALLAAGMTIGIGLPLTSVNAAVEMPIGDTHAPIAIRGDGASSWQQGQYQVWVVRGNVELKQSDVVARASEAVFWVDRAEPFSGRPSKVIVYLEGDARVDFGHRGNPHSITKTPAQTLHDKTWLGRFHTTGGIELSAPVTPGQPAVLPEIFRRGSDARDPFREAGLTSRGEEGSIQAASDGAVQPAQFLRQEVAPPTAGVPPAPGAGRRVRFFPRAGGRYQARTITDNDRNEKAVIVSSGVQILIDGVEQLGTVSIETDRLVAWVPNINVAAPGAGEALSAEDGPLEFYLEGNIVFRQGDRVIYADRMYYNVRQEYGVVLNAELLTLVPEYTGLVRLKADVLQQVNAHEYQAFNAAFTSSRIGVPRYFFQSQNITVTDTPRPLVDPFSGQPLVDQNGEPQVEHKYLARAQQNFVYVGGIPVFYWPTIATDLTKPTFYVDNINFNSDRIFGQQVLVDFDVYQLLGITDPPPNSKFTLSTDYLSERGFALGTTYRYQGDQFFGIPGPTKGFIDAWGLHDSGLDTLGRDRIGLVPEKRDRGRVLGQHRQMIGNDWQFTGELGLISDRNFLEQYYENEWDTFKDETTGVELKKYYENSSISLTSDVRVNDFFTQTNWLPRVDHFTLGQSLLFDKLTWHEHSQVGYASLGVATTPTAPQDAATFQLLPWERERDGVRAATRQEIDLPLEAGPVKIVPYAIGEAAFWGSDLADEQSTRLFGQGGIRASLPVWKTDPTIKSELFNLNGLSHKIVYEVDAFVGAADQDVTEYPLYDPVDDDNTEHFRRRTLFNTYGLTFGDQIPLKYDERLYAVRSNMQGWVTGQSTEIVDDQAQVRLSMKNRWQTKRGLNGQERIIDWITLDIDAVVFPKAERDNFGAEVGMLDYDFRWHVGDRFTLLSDGYADFFSQGLRQITIGGILNRPEQGSLYLGLRSTEGPISSNVLVGAVNYRLSEKWIGNFGTSIDFSSTGNIGQNVGIVRIGESFLLSLGFNYDASRNNYGFQFGIEPRFLPRGRLGRVGGVQVPPAGTMGLE